MVASSMPLTRSSFSTCRSPDSTSGSLTRNEAAVQPIGHWPKSRVALSHIVTCIAVGHDLELRGRVVLEAHAAGTAHIERALHHRAVGIALHEARFQ